MIEAEWWEFEDRDSLAQQVADARSVALAPLVQRPVVIGKTAVVPARFRVPEHQQGFHPGTSVESVSGIVSASCMITRYSVATALRAGIQR